MLDPVDSCFDVLKSVADKSSEYLHNCFTMATTTGIWDSRLLLVLIVLALLAAPTAAFGAGNIRIPVPN